MSIDKEDEAIDEQFSILIQPNMKIESYNYFKEITDIYLSKHCIPYTRDSSGSSVVYRCPFVDNCSFCIRGGISRSKTPEKKGTISIKSICLQHSCNWQETPRNKRTTFYRPTYKNRSSYLQIHKDNDIKKNEEKSFDGTILQNVGLDSYITTSDKQSLIEHSDIAIIPDSLPNASISKKRQLKQPETTQSKRPMYCRNAYMHYIVKQLIKQNPYISLRAILSILESKHIECKEVTVSRYRSMERAKYITPMKDLLLSLQVIKTQIQQLYPRDDIEIFSTLENEKEYFAGIYICPEVSRVIFSHSLHDLFLDCILLKNESGGVLYVAFTMDGGNKSILLAFMIAEEENQHNWLQFLSLLQKSQLITPTDKEYSVIHSLCLTLDSLFPILTSIQPELALTASSWYTSSSSRRKKTLNTHNYPSLRSIVYRLLFSSAADVSNYIDLIANMKNDILTELNQHPKWNRRCFDNPQLPITDRIIKEFEMNILEQRSIQYLMYDDIVIGLFTIMIESSMDRFQFYHTSETTSMYTPYYSTILNEYNGNQESYTIQSIDSSHFTTFLSSNPSLQYSIDIVNKQCSCGYWQQTHFPCIHAWKVLQFLKLPIDPLLSYFSCSSAMRMAPSLELPHFDHDLTQQTCYYLNNMENPFPKDITVLWNSIPPSTTLPSQDLKDLKDNKLPNDQKETDTSVESKKSFSL